MGIESLKTQISLSTNVKIEAEIIDYLMNAGKRSGLPKQFLIAGYRAMVGAANDASIVVDTSKKQPPKKPNLKNIAAGG